MKITKASSPVIMVIIPKAKGLNGLCCLSSHGCEYDESRPISTHNLEVNKPAAMGRAMAPHPEM